MAKLRNAGRKNAVPESPKRYGIGVQKSYCLVDDDDLYSVAVCVIRYMQLQWNGQVHFVLHLLN